MILRSQGNTYVRRVRFHLAIIWFFYLKNDSVIFPQSSSTLANKYSLLSIVDSRQMRGFWPLWIWEKASDMQFKSSNKIMIWMGKVKMHNQWKKLTNGDQKAWIFDDFEGKNKINSKGIKKKKFKNLY